MAKIGVIQANLHQFGGGQVVCMNVLEALSREHHVEVLSTSPAELEELNEFAGTDVTGVDVRSLPVEPLSGNLARLNRFGLLKRALLNRYATRIASQYDLLISTDNEVSLPPPSVQYIHVPQFDRPSVPGEEGMDTLVYQSYRRLCARVARFDERNLHQATLLANSEWTAGVTEGIYDTRPEVVYPPIKDQPAERRPWSEREAGFVAVGRLDPTKNYERMVRIVDELRTRDRGTHLHIVGPADSTEYAEKIRGLVDEREYIDYEGMISRERMFELLSTHRYGLHAKDFEHFGMAVAEMVLAGAVPFVPKNGGQQEIVNDDDRLLYRNIEDAVTKIAAVLDDVDRQRSIRTELPDVKERFGQRRFQAHIHRIVEDVLSGATE